MSSAIAETETSIVSESQLHLYRADGYCVVRNLIPATMMQPIKEEMLRLMHGEQDGWDAGHFQVVDPAKYRAPNGKSIPGGLQAPASRMDIFKQVADHPRLQKAMSEILGGPVARYTDQCLMKPAWIKEEQGGRTFFHQDSYYWLLRPEAGCNVWIPCDPVGKDAIALAVKPGSQRGWKLDEHEDYFDDPVWCSGRTGQPFKRHRIPLGKVDHSDEVLVTMQPGDAVFFTNYTWHRSEPNRSGQHLAAYAIAYQLADRDNKMASR